MKTIADTLLEEISRTQKLGKRILEVSGLNCNGVIYAFATRDALVINCKDYATTWHFDEGQLTLMQATARVKPSIRTIQIERSGKIVYSW